MSSIPDTKDPPILTRGSYTDYPEYGRVYVSTILPFEKFLHAWPESETKVSHNAGSFHRWHKIFETLLLVSDKLEGPTLDVASGHGLMYRPFKVLLPHVLPYSIAEMHRVTEDLIIDNDKIPVLEFECDKDLIPAPDRSFGIISFCDVLEHLIVDPIWTLLEFNRVLKSGGHLLISTPNTIAFDRIFKIFKGMNPGSENHYKPCSIYQRHNREWAPVEVITALNLIGFEAIIVQTFPDLYPVGFNAVHKLLRDSQLLTVPPEFLGPDIILVAKKIKHMTLQDDLPVDSRWPAFLYSGYDNYRKRPLVFPKLWGEDYA